MNLNFTKINKNEILKILQYRGSEIPKDIDLIIDTSIEDLRKYSKIKYKYKEYPKDHEDLEKILLGDDINELLISSNKILLVAVILDATASAGVESIMNEINEYLISNYKPMYLTDRFSPGYGDMPISVQKDFLNLLYGEKDLGVSTTSSGIMIPRKSITAIIGVSNEKQKMRINGCENCRLFLQCEFLKRGETCGYKK